MVLVRSLTQYEPHRSLKWAGCGLLAVLRVKIKHSMLLLLILKCETKCLKS